MRRRTIAFVGSVVCVFLAGQGVGQPAAEAAQAAQVGGQVTVPLNGEPKLLNPILRGEISAVIVNWAVFANLARADPVTLESKPDLAESWSTSADGKALTVKLRAGVKWHDGKPFTAEDVKFTYDKILDPKTNTGFRTNLLDLQAVEVVDARTVRFVLKQPSSAFVASLQIAPIPKHLLEGKDINTDPFIQKPVGTGPFRLKEIQPGNHVIVEANPDYYGGRPFLDRIVFKVVPDVNVRLAQIKTGEVDVVDAVEPIHLKDLESRPSLKIYRMDQTNYYGFFINWRKPPFDDLRVRKALNHAIDHKAIIERVLLGEATPATSVFPAAFGWAHLSGLPGFEYNPDRAKALLAEAGWRDTKGTGVVEKDGKPFKFELAGDKGSPTRERIVTLAQQYLKAIGLDVSIRFVEWGQFLEKYLWNPDKEMAYLWNAFNPPLDPDALARRWHSKSPPRENQTSYNNPKVDQLFDQARAARTQADRQKAYHEIQRLIHADVPMILVYYPREIAAVNAKLKGIVPSPFRVYHNMEQWYLEK